MSGSHKKAWSKRKTLQSWVKPLRGLGLCPLGDLPVCIVALFRALRKWSLSPYPSHEDIDLLGRAGLSFHPESHWSQSYYDRRCQVLKSREVCVLTSTECTSWCPHGPGHRYKVFPWALPTLPDGSSQERDMLTPLAHGDALLPLSPPPPRSRAPPSQGEVRSHTTLCPFSSPLLGSDLIFLHFTLHEREEALVSAHHVSGDFTQLPLQTSRVRSRSLGRSGNSMVFRN